MCKFEIQMIFPPCRDGQDRSVYSSCLIFKKNIYIKQKEEEMLRAVCIGMKPITQFFLQTFNSQNWSRIHLHQSSHFLLFSSTCRRHTCQTAIYGMLHNNPKNIARPLYFGFYPLTLRLAIQIDKHFHFYTSIQYFHPNSDGKNKS